MFQRALAAPRVPPGSSFEARSGRSRHEGGGLLKQALATMLPSTASRKRRKVSDLETF
jgi:hypothetical protein